MHSASWEVSFELSGMLSKKNSALMQGFQGGRGSDLFVGVGAKAALPNWLHGRSDGAVIRIVNCLKLGVNVSSCQTFNFLRTTSPSAPKLDHGQLARPPRRATAGTMITRRKLVTISTLTLVALVLYLQFDRALLLRDKLVSGSPSVAGQDAAPPPGSCTPLAASHDYLSNICCHQKSSLPRT